jgi:hypothetical protein
MAALNVRPRVGSDKFLGAQACISKMLRVCRKRVNVAAGKLQKRTLIRYSRGYIQVSNRNRLEAAACPCYAVQKQHCDAYLSAPKRSTLRQVRPGKLRRRVRPGEIKPAARIHVTKHARGCPSRSG